MRLLTSTAARRGEWQFGWVARASGTDAVGRVLSFARWAEDIFYARELALMELDEALQDSAERMGRLYTEEP